MGPKLSDQYREDTDRPPTRRPHVGRPGEYVFLDRSVDWGWRRILEPGTAVRGQKIVAALLRLRVRDLRHSLTASSELPAPQPGRLDSDGVIEPTKHPVWLVAKM